jgi:hypothetical protein
LTYWVVHAGLIGRYLRTTKRENRDSGIEAPMKVYVLALLIQRVVEHTTGESGFQLRHRLNNLQATKFRTATHHFFHRNEPPKELRGLFKKLNISMSKQVLASEIGYFLAVELIIATLQIKFVESLGDNLQLHRSKKSTLSLYLLALRTNKTSACKMSPSEGESNCSIWPPYSKPCANRSSYTM